MVRNTFVFFVVVVAIIAGAWLFIKKTGQKNLALDNPGSVTATPSVSSSNSPTSSMNPNTTTLEGGLQVTDAVIGTGAVAKAGDVVTVHYTGTFADGTKFDSSVDRGQPFSFQLGVGQVIKGWDLGVAGMKVGGKRTLVIPSALAYGEQGAGNTIPPNTTLYFTVELLAVKSGASK